MGEFANSAAGPSSLLANVLGRSAKKCAGMSLPVWFRLVWDGRGSDNGTGLDDESKKVHDRRE
jgi:hypothetical protein